MRPRTPIKLVALGLAARAFVRYQRSRRAARDTGAVRTLRDDLAGDPCGPVPGSSELVELQVEPLELDALSTEDAEVAQDLAGLEVDLDEIDEIDEIADGDDADLARVDVEAQGEPRDAGDLYGAHTPSAVDRDHPDDDHAYADGQNWLEALETSAIENGAEPERELDEIVDDEDVLRPPHPSDLRDTPVADLGSGGRRGL